MNSIQQRHAQLSRHVRLPVFKYRESQDQQPSEHNLTPGSNDHDYDTLDPKQHT